MILLIGIYSDADLDYRNLAIIIWKIWRQGEDLQD